MNLYAPCLHENACPALRSEGDWCHEDAPVNLPSWLVPVARAAGLRWEGLTFSYVIFRNDSRSLLGDLRGADRNINSTQAFLRVVSDRITTKGKSEAFLCGQFDSAESMKPSIDERARAMRLDRDTSNENDAWGKIQRGEVILVSPPPRVDRPRIGKETSVKSAKY